MKKISLLLILAIIFTVLPFGVGAETATAIEVGQYVRFGTYLGAPILWRCIDVNDKGYLLLSDKIITLKSFDAAGDKDSDPAGVRKTRGSDVWADSSLRTWLNSDDTVVTYAEGHIPLGVNVMNGINDYASEKGFLHSDNFSPAEISLIKPVSIPTAVGRVDVTGASEGSELHKYVATIGYSGSNYITAYKSYTTDLVFLPSVTDIEKIAASGTLGDEYFLGYPTSRAIAKSEQGYDVLSESRPYFYWTRDPVAFSMGDQVRCVYNVSAIFDRALFLEDPSTPFGSPSIDNVVAYNGGIGVRPALYINSDIAAIKSGTGSNAMPYVLTNTQSRIFISSDKDNAPAGTEAGVSAVAVNAPANATYKYYFNGGQVESFENLTLTRPENCFIAIMYDGQTEIDRAELILHTVNYEPTDTPLTLDFEGTSSQPEGFDGTWGSSSSGYVDNESGKSLKLVSGADAVSSLTIDTLSGKTGAIVVKADVNFSDFNFGEDGGELFTIKGKNSSAATVEYAPLVVSGDRYIRLNGTSSDNVLAYDLEEGTWHSIELIIDASRQQITVLFDGKVVCRNESFASADLITFTELVISSSPVGEEYTSSAVCLDNIAVHSIRGDRNFGYISDDRGLKLVNYAGITGPATVYLADNGIIVHKENITLTADGDIYLDTTLSGTDLEEIDVYVWADGMVPYDGFRKIGW